MTNSRRHWQIPSQSCKSNGQSQTWEEIEDQAILESRQFQSHHANKVRMVSFFDDNNASCFINRLPIFYQ